MAERRLSATSLRLIERLRKICLALPEANEKLSHGEPTWFAGKGKVFAMLDGYHHGSPHLSVWLPQPFGGQEALIDADPERFFRPPYVASPAGSAWCSTRSPTGAWSRAWCARRTSTWRRGSSWRGSTARERPSQQEAAHNVGAWAGWTGRPPALVGWRRRGFLTLLRLPYRVASA